LVRKEIKQCISLFTLIRKTKKFVRVISTDMKPAWKWKVPIRNSMRAVMPLSPTSVDKKGSKYGEKMEKL